MAMPGTQHWESWGGKWRRLWGQSQLHSKTFSQKDKLLFNLEIIKKKPGNVKLLTHMKVERIVWLTQNKSVDQFTSDESWSWYFLSSLLSPVSTGKLVWLKSQIYNKCTKYILYIALMHKDFNFFTIYLRYSFSVFKIYISGYHAK